jgi:hypothetical protein
MNKLFDKLWVKIDDINCNDVSFIKKDLYLMKDLDTCFITAEIDFTTSETVGNIIDIDIPVLDYDFPPCENTTFAIKNDDINTLVKVKILPYKLRLESFPFTPLSKYELNIQFFFMLKNPKTYLTATM